MELVESIKSINQQLIDHYGIDTNSSNSIWRVVFSDDQYEMRHGTYTDYSENGKIFLRTVTETRMAPKYKQWIHQKFILERLVMIPVVQLVELPATKVSYEPIWTFADKNDNYLPPQFLACKFIIDTIYAAQYGTHNLKKYNDPEYNQEASLEFKCQRVDAIIEELFGEQSSLQGTTVTGESIIVPRNYEKRGN